MSRRIVTTQLQAKGAPSAPVDDYFDRLVRYIPADIVAAWVAASGAIAGASDVPTQTLLWICFIVGLVLTAWWTWQRTQEPGAPTAVTQIVVSTGAFAVWVFALGGPFAAWVAYRPVYGTLLLILYTLLVARIVPKE